MDKKYKLVFIGLGIYVVIMAIVLLFNSLFKDHGNATLFIDNYSTWSYSNNKWSIIPKSDYKSYSWKKYDLYYQQKKLGNYYLMKNNDSGNWYIFDDSKKSINWKKGIIAFGGDLKTNLIDIKEKDMFPDEYEYAEEVLKSLNIKDTTIKDLPLKKKYLIDLDNDSTKEEIYAISNTYLSKTRKRVYSIVFLRKDGKNKVIYKKNEKFTDFYQGCRPSISTVFTIGRNKMSNVVVSCTYFSAIDVDNYLYEYNNKTNDFNTLLEDRGNK